MWDCSENTINTNSNKHILIENPYAFLTITWDGYSIHYNFPLPDYVKYIYLRVRFTNSNHLHNSVQDYLKSLPQTLKILSLKREIVKTRRNIGNNTQMKEKTKLSIEQKFYTEMIKFSKEFSIPQEDIISIHNSIVSETDWKLSTSTHHYLLVPLIMRWENILVYSGSENIFKFPNDENNTMALFGANTSGKSSIIWIFLFALYGTRSGISNEEILNNSSSQGYVEIDLRLSIFAGVEKILRVNRRTKKESGTSFSLSCKIIERHINGDDIKIEEIKGVSIIDTQRLLNEYIGIPNSLGIMYIS